MAGGKLPKGLGHSEGATAATLAAVPWFGLPLSAASSTVLATTCGGCRDSWAEVRAVGAPGLKWYLRLGTEEVVARRTKPKAIVGGARAEERQRLKGRGYNLCQGVFGV